MPRIVGTAYALEILFAADLSRPKKLIAWPHQQADRKRRRSFSKQAHGCPLCGAGATLSLALVKRATHRGMQMDLASGLEFETLVTTIYGTENKREGISAFLEKRRPSKAVKATCQAVKTVLTYRSRASACSTDTPAADLVLTMLSDLGADVIRSSSVASNPSRHNPPRYAEESVYFLSVNGGKKGLTIDLNARRRESSFKH